MMEKKNAIYEIEEDLNEESMESIDFDELEEKLQIQLEEEFADIEYLAEEKEKIGNPDNLGKVVMGIVWEQFLNQIAVTAGEDFIKENNNLTLDLRDDAHIQTVENFVQGKIATHNTKIDYQKRLENYQENFVKDKDGNILTHKTRSGKEEAVLTKEARKPFDEGRPKGSVENKTDMDHTIPVAEILRDPVANVYLSKEEQVSFANSDANLNEMDSSLNRSKGDKSMTDWLDNPNSNGQKPDEIFDISAEKESELRQKDVEAREEYEKIKKEGEKKAIETGKQSQREEAFRIGKSVLRAVVMQMLADLVREIIAKLVRWFKEGNKCLKTLLDSMKEAIHSFIAKMKTHLINAGNTMVSTIATAIIGPVFRTINKVIMLLKQGWSSLKSAISYIKNPDNKGKPIGLLLMEVGKIVITGITGAGALVLSEVIEKGLMTVPVFAIDIPLLGSLANVLGIFFGAVVSGIIGAIALNLLDKLIAKKKKTDLLETSIDKRNKILSIQAQQKMVLEAKLEDTKENVQSNISNRHYQATKFMKDSFANIMEDFVNVPSFDNNVSIIDEEDIKTGRELNKISNDLDELLNSF